MTAVTCSLDAGLGGLPPAGFGAEPRPSFLNARRVRRWAAAFVAVHLLCFALIAAGSHGWIVPLHGSGTTDFVSFYAAGSIDAASVYDRAVHYAAERAATEPGIPYVYFFYPPVFLLVCRVLATLPYLVAFVAFELATLGLYLLAVRAVLGPGVRGWLLPVLGFAPLLWNMGFGQNALLTAGLFGWGCVLMRQGRSLLGGVVLGLLIYKPHTGLLLPVALLAGREWRALAGAALGAGGAVAASVLAFGVAPWVGFARAIARSGQEFAGGAITPFGAMVNLAGALRDWGVGPGAALVAQGVLQAVLAGCVWWSWNAARGRAGGEVRYAVLAAAAVPMMPVVLFYDLALASVGACFLVAAARRTGFLAGERLGLAACWVAGGICYPVARAWHVPLGLCCCLVLVGLCVRRAWWMRAGVARVARMPAGLSLR